MADDGHQDCSRAFPNTVSAAGRVFGARLFIFALPIAILLCREAESVAIDAAADSLVAHGAVSRPRRFS
jgi:hypothetical protein